MSTDRYNAIKLIDQRQPKKVELQKNTQGTDLRVSDYYGANTLCIGKMKDKLPKDVYQKLMLCIQEGNKLDQSIANAVAKVVLEWSIENGVSHFCHWFQPQTGTTAEKHDSFVNIDSSGRPIEKFSGSQLIQSEPDASSFPSGGMRTTFEARGYTAWDPSSPIFFMEGPNGKTLCIPSVFISYHGDALDEKTPLLRSMEALNDKAVELLHTMGFKSAKRVVPTLGAEQEYFLIDSLFFNSRPDLMMTGRTLLGGQPPKGQQLEDHYFGSVSPRVLAFMQELEIELYKLGVPAKTRHNEVAPSQYEMAPIFEEANVSSDHNQIVMEAMRRIAQKHNFKALLHEKPFAGINGSGKHCNWSMAITDVHGDGAIDDANLLEPGKTPHQNLRFLMILSAVLKGVYRHSGLLRAAIATPGNDHRLGANEAPPAIISVFLGQQLTEICNHIEQGLDRNQSAEAAVISLGVSKLPVVSKDNTDRNRTSPFAFTGNKFEFRAVGSSSPTSFPITVVNAAVAEAMGELNALLLKKLQAGLQIDSAVLEVVKETLLETKNVRFEGNNYSEEWVKEAEKRRLHNLKKAPEAMGQLLTANAKKLFKDLNILNDQELHSRYHVMIERYVKKLTIEAETLMSMVSTYVIPAALKEQIALSSAIRCVKEVQPKADTSEQMLRLNGILESTNRIAQKKNELNSVLAKISAESDEVERAKILSSDALSLMGNIRSEADSLEAVISDEFWPLPKYREMLFIA